MQTEKILMATTILAATALARYRFANFAGATATPRTPHSVCRRRALTLVSRLLWPHMARCWSKPVAPWQWGRRCKAMPQAAPLPWLPVSLLAGPVTRPQLLATSFACCADGAPLCLHTQH